MNTRISNFLLLISIIVCAGCANITAPTGGKRDKTPPKLLEIDPPDSLLNTKVTRIEMHFDEYVTVSDVSKEVQISPILTIAPSVTGLNKHVVTKIIDSFLEDNTTYRISYGSSIKDLHEGNAFRNYTYTFSTGKYFDSLILQGTVINALTGLPDTSGVVELYSAKENDSAVVRHKPKYVTKTGAGGLFKFKGLPKRSFRIYALKDANGNLVYDGPVQGEMIAFNDSTVIPGDTSEPHIRLRMFTEIADTGMTKKSDSVSMAKDKEENKRLKVKGKHNKKDSLLTYKVELDSNAAIRTFDITRPVTVSFNKRHVIDNSKIRLTYMDNDSNSINAAISVVTDSLHPQDLLINTDWLENTVYTLWLSKGFAKDTAGADVKPSKYSFRTFDDDDYGKLHVHLPAKYNDRHFVFLVASDKDTIWNKPVVDTVIDIERIRPAKYTLRIIVDKNGNGKWDTGDLLAKLQPEEIIPYSEPVDIKAGWDNTLDFEPKPKPKNDPPKTGPK